MKKHILLTISILFAGLTSFAANGDRFRYGGIWYEILDESAQTCQTASAHTIQFEERMINTGTYDNSGKERINEGLGLTGTFDPAVYEDDSRKWATDQNALAGPNWMPNSDPITIPEKAFDENYGKEYKVIGIGNFSFACDGSIKSNMSKISLPPSLEYIGEGAFMGCWGLYDIEIPKSVKRIEKGAFASLKNLQKVTFNEGLEYIGEYAFSNCTALGGHGYTLAFPDSLEEIAARAFYGDTTIHHFTLGSGLETVGENAFWNVGFDEQGMHLYLPANLKNIGEGAFNFETNGSNFTDVFYPNPEPTPYDEGDPYPVDDRAFGLVDKNDDYTWDMDYYIYATVCLHVPYGTLETYKNLPGWGNFKCIIDDILPVDPRTGESRSEDPMAYIIDYIYLVPGDKVNLTELLDEKDKTFIWKEITENDEDGEIVQLDKDGNLKALSYGNVVALANRTEIYKEDKNGNLEKQPDAIVGAVVIFVCPTITVVYDKEGLTDTESVTNPSNSRAQVRAKVDGDIDANNEAAQLQQSNTTYSHAVVFDSYPKVQVNPTGQIKIESLERASLDPDKNNDFDKDGLTEVKNWDVKSESYPGAVLPDNPVKEDRLLVVNLAVPYGISTDNTPIEIDQKVSVITIGRTLKILGADDESEVRIVNIQGQNVYHGVAKVIDLEPGIYIITVEDAAFKAIVK